MTQAAVIMFAISALILLLGGTFLTVGLSRRRLVRDWVQTTGEVVSCDGSLTGWLDRYPTFRWEDHLGQEHERTSSVRRGMLGPWPGRSVPVRYDPGAPDRAVIDTFAQRGTVFTAVGALLLVLVLVLLSFLVWGATAGS